MIRIFKSSLACIATLALTSYSYGDNQSALPDSPLSQFAETFKRSVSTETQPNFTILKSLSLSSKNAKETNKLIESRDTYPQGFEIDEKLDLLYILRYSSGHPARAVIEKYQWSSGKQLATYIIREPQRSISEGLVVDNEGERTVVYLRSDNKLARYQLLDAPSNTGTTQKLDSPVENAAQSFYRKGDKWYIEKYKTAKDSLGQTRGAYVILDNNFKYIKDIIFPPQYSGYRESKDLDIPKHQGFAVLDNGYAMSMGGSWTETSKTTPYHYFGINIFNKEGEVVRSEYVSPKTLISQLSELGVDANGVENEGIQAMSDGSLIALMVVRSKDEPKGKLLFLGFKL